VELDRDRVADIAQRHGVDEREALILYHLGHAFELYFEIAKEEDHSYERGRAAKRSRPNLDARSRLLHRRAGGRT
jgi:hypothetical protein